MPARYRVPSGADERPDVSATALRLRVSRMYCVTKAISTCSAVGISTFFFTSKPIATTSSF